MAEVSRITWPICILFGVSLPALHRTAPLGLFLPTLPQIIYRITDERWLTTRAPTTGLDGLSLAVCGISSFAVSSGPAFIASPKPCLGGRLRVVASLPAFFLLRIVHASVHPRF
ncbi:hypothetical protein B0T22DRAFT_279296 [Podospora appendiculata]|uniref:Uncharacterized protein n=1 Tax=Podospora appendiculata TaxID=314037 RepID=A0AAE0X0M6_9PEZI|nr:hypothetical protein B0T22DRAFT_279296 [Podospora appendiculata]